MEKTKLVNNTKISPISNKDKVGKKIESLWNENLSLQKISKTENKKLVIKLETTGKERRKILLKMESTSSKTQNNNYFLISELLKEFFNGNSNLE